jgi:uncharacterized protein (UPF0548 family)
VLRLSRPTDAELAELLAAAQLAAPSYEEVGATAAGERPPGYRHDTDEIELGRAPDTFARARSAVREWRAQTGAGITLFPSDSVVEPTATVLLVIRASALWAVAPCRVVYVDENDERFSFAYGTLPGHPERGEASFTVFRRPDGAVVFRVASFSRPVDPLARLGRPVARLVQRRVTRRYLTAIAAETRTDD